MIKMKFPLMRESISMAVFGRNTATNEDHGLRKRCLDLSRQRTYSMIPTRRRNIRSHKR